ncbi:hypothetical protein BHM03_00038676 [Ensete ventricosum]|nr:hypothetical protein BHM03_00038676 [Ensete ventricosum]
MAKTHRERCRPSGYDRDVRRTCDCSSMGQGHGATCYINGRETRQCRTRSPPPRIPDRLSTWSLELTWLPPKCCYGCPTSVSLDESERSIGYPISKGFVDYNFIFGDRESCGVQYPS